MPVRTLLSAVFRLLKFSAPEHADLFDGATAAAKKGDFAAAFPVFKRFAEQGDAHAQSYLGLMYGNGQGVTQDHTAAAFWYRKATDQGMPTPNSISASCTITAGAWRRITPKRFAGIARRPIRGMLTPSPISAACTTMARA